MSLAQIKLRSLYLQKVRLFFQKEKYIEVDTPELLKRPNLDLNIIPIKTNRGYLHTSPEYNMKILLSQGCDKIYFLGHVFRKEEIGSLHNEEFTMIEWYKKNTNFKQFIEEIFSLIKIFIDKKLTLVKYTYQELFLKYLNINPHTASKKGLLKILKDSSYNSFSKKDLLDLILAEKIEKHLSNSNHIYVIYDFPRNSSLYATTDKHITKRFEFFYKSIEIANGYHELNDYNQQKENLKKTSKLLDINFLNAIKKGIGDNTFGVACGFDRLLMLSCNKTSIQ